MKKLLEFIILFLLATTIRVYANTYTNDTNLFENSYSNNLLDLAYSQIPNFPSYKYLIFQNGTSYYLIASKDYNINTNVVYFNNTYVISAIRYQNNYNYYYNYSTTEEATTSFIGSNLVLTNLEYEYAVSSSHFNNYYNNYYENYFYILFLGLLFAIFLLKGRR